MSKVGAYLERCGIEFDTEVNVLTGGGLGQTVSMRAALGWRAKKPGWCLFCRFLDIAVQRHHCALQFSDEPAPVPVYLRAGIAFGVGITALAAIAHTGLELAARLF